MTGVLLSLRRLKKCRCKCKKKSKNITKDSDCFDY